MVISSGSSFESPAPRDHGNAARLRIAPRAADDAPTLRMTLDASADGAGLARDGAAVLALGLAALCGVALVLPPEGRVSGVVHQALEALLGQLAFVLPFGLVLGASVLLLRSLRPGARVPAWRLVGLGPLLLASLAGDDILTPGGAGLAGRWLSALLLDWFGALGTFVVLATCLSLGTLLTFHIHIHIRTKSQDAAS